MNDLIWFSIPGAIALYALYFLFPTLGTAPAAVLVGAAPVLGFIIHQAYRMIFEWFEGWESPRRPVIALIQQAYGITKAQKRTAFLIWETTFYSDRMPEAFRDHNRGMWHYVMSFRSVCLAAGASSIALVLVPFCAGIARPPIWTVIGFAITTLVFWLKGRFTYLSLIRQEVAAFQVYRAEFDAVHKNVQAA